MKSWTLENGYTVLQLLDRRSNVYLIDTGADYILVDTGPAGARKKLAAQLAACGVRKDRLKYLILTHTHFDHCGNAGYIADHFGPQVIVHAAEAAYLENGFSPLPRGAFAATRVVSGIGMLLKPLFKVQKAKADLLVEHSFSLQPLGYDLELVHTPGHSPGSISVIVHRELALAGDTLFGVFTRSVIPPFYTNRMQLMESYKKLLKYNCRLYLPGHGQPITLQRLKEQFCRYTLPY